jgi:hypothetical protein
MSSLSLVVRHGRLSVARKIRLALEIMWAYVRVRR